MKVERQPENPSRRSFLTSAAKNFPLAAIVLPVGTATADTASLSPIMALFREWQALHEAAENRSLTDEECNALCEKQSEIEGTILALPSTSAADFAAKLCAYTGFGVFELQENVAPKLWAEARELLIDAGVNLGSESHNG